MGIIGYSISLAVSVSKLMMDSIQMVRVMYFNGCGYILMMAAILLNRLQDRGAVVDTNVFKLQVKSVSCKLQLQSEMLYYQIENGIIPDPARKSATSYQLLVYMA